MAGRLFIVKDHKQRINHINKMYNKYILNILHRDFFLPEQYYYHKKSYGKPYSISKIKTRCIFSGRSKAIINKFKMSRMIFKRLSEEGTIVGIKKSSW